MAADPANRALVRQIAADLAAKGIDMNDPGNNPGGLLLAALSKTPEYIGFSLAQNPNGPIDANYGAYYKGTVPNLGSFGDFVQAVMPDQGYIEWANANGISTDQILAYLASVAPSFPATDRLQALTAAKAGLPGYADFLAQAPAGSQGEYVPPPVDPNAPPGQVYPGGWRPGQPQIPMGARGGGGQGRGQSQQGAAGTGFAIPGTYATAPTSIFPAGSTLGYMPGGVEVSGGAPPTAQSAYDAFMASPYADEDLPNLSRFQYMQYMNRFGTPYPSNQPQLSYSDWVNQQLASEPQVVADYMRAKMSTNNNPGNFPGPTQGRRFTQRHLAQQGTIPPPGTGGGAPPPKPLPPPGPPASTGGDFMAMANAAASPGGALGLAQPSQAAPTARRRTTAGPSPMVAAAPPSFDPNAYLGAAQASSASALGGLPLTGEQEAGMRLLEDALAAELASLGVSWDQIPVMVKLMTERLATDQTLASGSLDESLNARGIYNSGIRPTDQFNLGIGFDRSRQDLALSAAQSYASLAQQAGEAYGDYQRGLMELLLALAAAQAQNPSMALPMGAGSSVPMPTKPGFSF